MTDKPIPAKILLTLSNNKITGEEFIAFSGSLYQQNLIYSEPRELRRNKNILELTIVFRDNTSFKNWDRNAEIRELWLVKFDNYFLRNLKQLKKGTLFLRLIKLRIAPARTQTFIFSKEGLFNLWMN